MRRKTSNGKLLKAHKTWKGKKLSTARSNEFAIERRLRWNFNKSQLNRPPIQRDFRRCRLQSIISQCGAKCTFGNENLRTAHLISIKSFQEVESASVGEIPYAPSKISHLHGNALCWWENIWRTFRDILENSLIKIWFIRRKSDFLPKVIPETNLRLIIINIISSPYASSP